jgi:putative methyltransferase
VIQSFSSNLPPFVLFEGLDLNKDNNKGKKFNIIDACSAPGNKTLQLSEYLDTKGVVYAFEKDERRFGNLCKNIGKYGATNV